MAFINQRIPLKIFYPLILRGMQVYTDINHLPPFKNAVITIGSFDGVHTGHMAIINELLREAKMVAGNPVLITFNPHPSQVISGRPPVNILSTREEKLGLLEKAGVPYVVEVPFTMQFSEQSAHEYIHQFLVKCFHPHTIIIGYDHRFGKGRQGDYQLLEEEGKQAGFKVKEIPVHLLRSAAISSTRIREALQKGEVEEASQLLGHPYFFSGTVVRGNQLGRTLGYPTANLQVAGVGKLIPGNAVYAVECTLNKETDILQGMMNIGVRPTVDGSGRVIEVNLFHFNRDIYEQTLTVTIKRRLRWEKKFPSLEALKSQLAADEQDAIRLFNPS